VNIKLKNIIAVHSYKGGTGKTSLSVNLAASLAKRGRKVAILDLDFRAPSLFSVLKMENSIVWLNDYLNGASTINKILQETNKKTANNGKLFAGLANPSTEAIRDMSAKDRKWEMRALGRLLSLRNSLLKDQNFDYIIFDTSPGLQYSSINAIVAADLVVVATTSDRSDVNGTSRMLRELYNLFEKKTGVVINKVLDANLNSKKEELNKRAKDIYQVPLLGLVPCFCELLKAQGNLIFVQDRPNHPFTKIMDEIATRIEKDEI
jgi:septum site-determining protein MinD